MTKFKSKNIIYGNSDNFTALDHDPYHGVCWGCIDQGGSCEGPDCDTVAATLAYCQAEQDFYTSTGQEMCSSCDVSMAGSYNYFVWSCSAGTHTATTCDDDYVDEYGRVGCGADLNCTWVPEGSCSSFCVGDCTYTCEEDEGQNIYIATHTNCYNSRCECENSYPYQNEDLNASILILFISGIW